MIEAVEQRCWAGMRQHYREIFAEDPDQMVWEWCENSIYLSELETDYPGLLDTDLTPWIREPLECLRDDEVEEITIIAGTQVIKTLFLICAIAWWAKHRGTRMLFVMDTIINAGDFSESRLQTVFENSPELQPLIPVDRKSKWNKHKMYIGRGLLNLTGANSPGNVASRPAPFVAMDEVGKFKEKTEKETDTVSLATSRTKSKLRRKIIITSSPTYEFGLEWKAFRRGSQEVFQVKCPHCKEYIELQKDAIRWCPLAKRGGQWNMDLVYSTAHYVCQECGGHIGSHQKRRINRDNRWLVQNPTAPRSVRTFRVPSYYSPWESCSFGAVAVKFLQCKAEFNMKDFDNNWDAMPSVDQVEKLEWEILSNRKEKYDHVYPVNTAYLTAFVDVQKDRFEWFCIAWGKNDEHWLVEFEIVNADPSEPDEWRSIAEVIGRDRPVSLEWTFIDYGGHWHSNAINFVRSMQNRGLRVHLAQGSKDSKMPEKGRRTKTRVKPKTTLFETGVDQAKAKIYKMLSRSKVGRGYCHFPDWLDDEYFKQLTAEERRPKTEKGRTVYYWHPTRDRNEALDGHVGCYIAKLQIPLAKRKRLQMEAEKRKIERIKEAAGPDPVEADDVKSEIEKEVPIKKRRRRGSRGWM